LRPEMVAHLFRRQMGCLQRMGHSAGAWRCTIMIRCMQMLCRRELRGCGAAAAELPLERCCIDTRCAQKWWHICFGGNGMLAAYWTLSRSLAMYHHARCWPLLCRREQREQCLSVGGRRRKSSASGSAADGMLTAYGTLSRSLAMYHHARCWPLLCRREQRGCWCRGR